MSDNIFDQLASAPNTFDALATDTEADKAQGQHFIRSGSHAQASIPGVDVGAVPDLMAAPVAPGPNASKLQQVGHRIATKQYERQRAAFGQTIDLLDAAARSAAARANADSTDNVTAVPDQPAPGAPPLPRAPRPDTIDAGTDAAGTQAPVASSVSAPLADGGMTYGKLTEHGFVQGIHAVGQTPAGLAAASDAVTDLLGHMAAKVGAKPAFDALMAPARYLGITDKARAISAGIDKAIEPLDIPPELRENMPAKVAGNIGALGGILITGWMGGRATQGTVLISQGFDSMAEQVRAKHGQGTVGGDIATLAGGAAMGLLENANVKQLLEWTPPQFRSAVADGIVRLGTKVGKGAAIGAAIQLNNNVAIKLGVDPQQALGEGVGESAAIMGITDLLMYPVVGGGARARLPGNDIGGSAGDGWRRAGDPIRPGGGGEGPDPSTLHGDSSGNPFTWATPKQAAMYAAKNQLGGSHDLAVMPDGSYALKRRAPLTPGVQETAAAAAAQPTAEDLASPLPTADLVAGRATMARDAAAPKANAILAAAGVPPVGTRVDIHLNGQTLSGTVHDAYETNVDGIGVSRGVQVKLDDGTDFEQPFDVLRDMGAKITPRAATSAAGAGPMESQGTSDAPPPPGTSLDQVAPVDMEGMVAKARQWATSQYGAGTPAAADYERGYVAGAQGQPLDDDASKHVQKGHRVGRGHDGGDALLGNMIPITLGRESGGHDFAKGGGLLTSRAGAEGRMQTMPGTQADPGYGVTPARDHSPEEIARVGRDYLAAMLKRYGDPAKAWAAYNGGPGRLDDAMREGGADWLAHMPKETRDYVAANMARLRGGDGVAPTATVGDTTPAATPPGPTASATSSAGGEAAPSPLDTLQAKLASGEPLLPTDLGPGAAAKAPEIAGAKIDSEWTAFAPSSGTLGIPRADMPQIKAEHRGAMVNFLNARGIAHEEQTVPASSLKPTQAEFSPAKVAKAHAYEGDGRAILTSSDGHVLDGHHQWIDKHQSGEDVRTIRLDAPIRDLIQHAHAFPSSTTSSGSEAPAPTKMDALKGKLAGKAGETRLRDWSGVDVPVYEEQGQRGEYDGGPTKEAFLKDGRTYLTAVSKLLAADGFAPGTDRKGKPAKAVRVSEGGTAVSGDVHLELYPSGPGQTGVQVTFTKSSMTGPKGGASIIARTIHPTTRGLGSNNWLPADLSAAELAERLKKIASYEVTHTPPPAEGPARTVTVADMAKTHDERVAASTAPEHAAVGVDDRELSQIVGEFNQAHATGNEVTHVFDPPAKGDIVRLADKVRVYHADHGWMTPAEARAKIDEWQQHAVAQGRDPKTRSANHNRIVLSLFDLSGAWSAPWEQAGYQVWRFDIQADKEVGDVHNFSTEFFGDWFGDFDGLDVYAILAACPCTDFAVSGARHFAAKDADGRTVASVKLVHQTLATIEHFKPAVWAIENPVGRIEKLTGLPPWRLSFDPNHLGEPYTKKTLLWGRFNGDLPVAPVEPTEGSKMHSQYGGKSLATKNARSVTPEGFAYGFFMANNAVDHPAMAIANKYDRLDRGLIEEAVKAGVTEEQISKAVDDHYYMDLDDEAANAAIRALIPAPTKMDALRTKLKGEPDTLSPEQRALIERGRQEFEPETMGWRRAVRILQQGALVHPEDHEFLAEMEKRAAPDTPEPADRTPADIGAEAYALGAPRVPPQALAPSDQRKWLEGWDRANLAAPVTDEPAAQPEVPPKKEPPIVAFRAKAAEIERGLPPVLAGHTRVWRGNRPGEVGENPSFTTDLPGIALPFQKGYGGDLSYVDVPDALAEPQNRAGATDAEIILPAEWAARARTVPPREEASASTNAPPNEEPQPEPAGEQPKARASGYGAKNKYTTRERADEIRRKLRDKLNQLNSGVDPETMALGIELGMFHLEAGARKFADFVKAVADDLGMTPSKIKPFVRGWYNGARDTLEDHGEDVGDMDGPGAVRAALSMIPDSDTQSGQEIGHALPNDGAARTPRPGAEAVPQSEAGGQAGRLPQREGGSGNEAVRGADSGPGQDAKRGGDRPAGETQRDRGGDGADARRPGERRAAGVDRNYVIADGGLEESRGPKQKARDNLFAIELVRQLERDGRLATAAEQEGLAKYVGWGGLKGAFADPVTGDYAKGFEEIGRRLKEVLTPDEYDTARRSIQYAHYTSEKIVREMWRAVEQLGFTGGTVFEPGMGTGNFAGMMPATVRGRTQYAGIEMDGITAAIAKALYPKHGVQQADFTQYPLSPDTFDLVIGNPPFSETIIKGDPAYKRHGFVIHDYFFAKSLDMVRPGGLLAFVTSAGTMNKLDTGARDYLADRANLVGAIRLPGDAFEENAGTKVTTDIIFLRKRMPGEAAGDRAWTETGEFTAPNKAGEQTTGAVSRYFLDHPEQVLGKAGFFDPLYPNRYAVKAEPGEPFEAKLAAAIDRLGSGTMQAPRAAAATTPAVDLHSTEKKTGTFYIGDGGKLYQHQGGVGRLVQTRAKGEKGGIGADEQEKIKALVPIRDALRTVYAHDLAGRAKEGDAARAELNRHYDAFVAKHGPINKKLVTFRRPSRVQVESAWRRAREEARERGFEWEDGTFDPTDLYDAGATVAEVARAREEMKAAAETAGEAWDNGTFNPDDVPDTVIEKMVNVHAFMDDPESFRLLSIEEYDDATGAAKKGPAFYMNVVSRQTTPTISSAQDALYHSLNLHGAVDLDEIARLAGSSPQQVVEDLTGQIFHDPATGGWEVAARYLSGNVREKLKLAEEKAGANPALRPNVEALRGVLPADLGATDVRATLGMHWIDPADVTAFAKDALGLSSFVANYSHGLATWSTSGDRASAAATQDWGTSRRAASELINDALNGKSPKIYDSYRDANGNSQSVLNQQETQAANDKLVAIKERFKEWVWEDEDRKARLLRVYNDLYNSHVAPAYDGSHLTTPGVSAHWKWRDHQTRGVARITMEGNTYLAHAVGAGKTSTMIGAAMEMKRLGLVNKPMFVVPNHMLVQFTKEFYELYPTARIMVADEDRSFIKDRRKQFVSDMATSDLDAVIIKHSAFGLLPLSIEFQKRHVQDHLDELRAMLSEMKADKGADTRITKRKVEQQIEAAEQRLRAVMTRRTDETFTFEETGVDFLFVDEAHLFRKLDFATGRGDVKGIDPQGSMRSMDLYMKTRYLEGRRPGRSHVLASGTPITNTMAELYTVSRYLQAGELRRRGIDRFDAWAGAFGDTVTELEPTAAGTYKPQTRFSQFVNVPELSVMVRQNMDVVTPEQLSQYVVRPNVRRHLEVVPQTQGQAAYQTVLQARMKALEERKGPPKKGEDIILKVIGDGRKSAIDMRLVDPAHPAEDTKLTKLIDNVFRVWKESKKASFHGIKDGGYTAEPVARGPAAQMVFASLGVGANMKFNVHRFIAEELVRRGVPRGEIVLFNTLKSDVAKQRVFNDMNEGKVRVLVGSVDKMGTGVNAQRRLIANHNLDPEWLPSSDEQRNGRIIRQGNMNPNIDIFNYSTKGTYDSAMWGMMGRKAKFIEGFFRGDPTLRDMEDLGEASAYEQAKALTTKDPRILELTEAKQELEKELRRESAHDSAIADASRRARQARAWSSTLKAALAHEEADIAQAVDLKGDAFAATLGKRTFDDRQAFQEALTEAMTSDTRRRGTHVIGKLGGFDLALVSRLETHIEDGRKAEHLSSTVVLILNGDKGDEERYKELSRDNAAVSAQAFIARLPNIAEGTRKEIERFAKEATDFQGRYDQAAPYPGKAKIAELSEKVDRINAELARETAATETKVTGGQPIAQPTIPAPEDPDDPMPPGVAAPQASFNSDVTDTPAFRRWFGDSQVVDAKGNPLVVYHGSPDGSIEAFDPSRGRHDNRGLYFTTDPKYARVYARRGGGEGAIYPVYLSIQNPLVIDRAGGSPLAKLRAKIDKGFEKKMRLENVERSVRTAYFTPERIAELKAQGYDGIINHSVIEGRYTEIVVFEPTQIKSVHNGGAFDPSDPSILAEPGTAFHGGTDGPDRQSLDVRGHSDAVPARRGGTVRALGVAETINREGVAALVGREVSAPADLAELAQVYRDPRYETLRVFFMKGDKIVHATGVSARDPGNAPLLPTSMANENFLDWIRKTKEEAGADGFYMLHNHPSGDPSPSFADRRITLSVAQVEGYRGHVIINSNRYAVIDGKDQVEVHDRAAGADRLLEASKPHPLLGQIIASTPGLAEAGKALQRPGFVTLVVSDSKLRVRAVVDYAESELARPDMILLGALRRMQRMAGGRALFLIGSKDALATPAVRAALANGVLVEAMDHEGNPQRQGIAPASPSPLEKMNAQFVSEDTMQFADEETEKRWQEASKGIQTTGDGFITRVKVGLQRIGQLASRHWEHLPNVPKYADLQQKLRQVESAPTAARERAVHMLTQMVKGFTRADLDLFTRKIVLDDLAFEVEREHDLPFGFTPETMRAAKAAVDAAVAARPDLTEAVRRRKAVNREIARDLVAAGVLDAERVKNPAYYRHMVLDYARAERAAAAANPKLRSPRWARREGSTMDINANLLEAEFDWLAKALVDIPVAKTINWIEESEHNILPDLRATAKATNKNAIDELLREDLARNGPEGDLVAQDQQFRRNIAMGFKFIEDALDTAHLDVPDRLQSSMEAIMGGGGDPFPFLSWLLDNNLPGSNGAAVVLKNLSMRRIWHKELLGRDYLDPTDARQLVERLAPEGYAPWSPDESMLLFTVKTVPEHAIDEMMRRIDAAPGQSPEAVRAFAEQTRQALAFGGERFTMALPQEVADTLNELRRPDVDGFVSEIAKKLQRTWKQWVLINPRRVLKYNLNNLSGDLDAIIAGNPKALRHVGAAAVELTKVMRGLAEPSERYLEAVERGVFDSGLSVQEIPEINTLSRFANLADGVSMRPDKLLKQGLGKVWRALQGSTQWRENVLRYAAYLDYASRIEAGESQAKIGYGASLPKMVDAVTDPRDKAALLARDLVGDYGNVSVTGQWLRKYLIPFWSWKEINTRRYWRLSRNAFYEAPVRGFATAGALGAMAGARTGLWLAMRMGLLYGLISLWNMLMHPDAEAELDDEQRRQLHVILGHDPSGQVVTLRLQGALSDALAWFGLGDAANAIHDVEKGTGSWLGILKAAPKATVNQLASSTNPFLQEMYEAGSGRKIFPDVFARRFIRDQWRNVFQTWSLENEYDLLMHKPSRGYGASWIDSTVYRRDPGEIAYNKARTLAFDWMQKKKGGDGFTPPTTPRANALYDYRAGKRFEDPDAERAAVEQMVTLGMTLKDVKTSIKHADPLGSVPKKYRKEFVASLTDEEKDTFRTAEGFYRQRFLEGPASQ